MFIHNAAMFSDYLTSPLNSILDNVTAVFKGNYPTVHRHHRHHRELFSNMNMFCLHYNCITLVRDAFMFVCTWSQLCVCLWGGGEAIKYEESEPNASRYPYHIATPTHKIYHIVTITCLYFHVSLKLYFYGFNLFQ